MTRRFKIGSNLWNMLYQELLELVNENVTRVECVDNIMRLIEIHDEELKEEQSNDMNERKI